MTPPRSAAWLRAFAILWIGLLAGFATGIEWIRTRPAPPAPSGGIDLVGAGSTFVFPLYRRWFADYATATGIRINYLSLGSGEGIRLLLDGEVDFGATDRPLRPDERSRATCGPVMIPTTLGTIAVVTNLPGVRAPLQFDPDLLSGIYLGRITRWDAAPVRALNPGVTLPSLAIQVVHRAPTSGTSAVFEDYLRRAAAWRDARPTVGAPWPVGTGFEGNEGVASQVQVTVGAIGFVELSYAIQSRLTVAALRNTAGRFVLPDSASLAATMHELVRLDLPDSTSDLNEARGPNAYPVVAVTRLVMDQAFADERRAALFVGFARWVLREGASASLALGYAPLPAATAAQAERRLDLFTPGRCPASAGTD